MSASDWFRKKTWTPADQGDFFARLKRSRGQFHKAQYLRIQAYELQTVGTEELLNASLELLKQLFEEFPDKSQLAQAAAQQGDCLKGLGKTNEALASYRKAMEIQKQKTSCATNAYRSFAWLVATKPIPDAYGDALSALNEFGKHETFPIEHYQSSASRALIYEAEGKIGLAKSWACEALNAAAKEHSGFRYHSKLGLVRNPETKVFDRLKKLSA
jgi:tetratricopeptide (TPR) repeat protein